MKQDEKSWVYVGWHSMKSEKGREEDGGKARHADGPEVRGQGEHGLRGPGGARPCCSNRRQRGSRLGSVDKGKLTSPWPYQPAGDASVVSSATGGGGGSCLHGS